MRKKLLIGVIAVSSLLPGLMLAKDPVVMTINGKDIKLSEFEYLYNKNKQQQLEKQPFNKYVDMFVTYKLKVADAEAAGIDAQKSFLNEFKGYRNDLAKPYLEDKTTNDRLAKEAYERMKEEVDVSHIMVSLRDASGKSSLSQKRLLDSIRTCIVNGQDFGELALKYSTDPAVKSNKGHMGYVSAGRLPYAFEYAAYNTPVGSISEVIETPFGYHIVKANARRASKGTVLVEHILKLFPKDVTPEKAEETKLKIDSIYKAIKAGADFEELARKTTDDRGTRQQGGRLPWFGAGQMVPEFEKVAFEMPKDSISTPFKTAYGFHIIKKLDSKGVPPFAEVKESIMSSFSEDSRNDQARVEKLKELKKQYKYTINSNAKKEIYDAIDKYNGFDSLMVADLSHSKTPLVTFGKNNTITIKDFITKHTKYGKLNAETSKLLMTRLINEDGDEALLEYIKSELEKNVPEFGNLIHEYRDGLLLFEISNRNVWDKSSKDKEGLEAYFKAHKNKYVWTAPKYKGYLIQTINDSVANLVKDKLASVGSDSLIQTLKKIFTNNIRIEKMLVAKGENQLIDAIEFGNNKGLQNPNKRFPIYFTYDGRIISQPEEANDVRGQVTVDYQTQLEEQWVSQLKKKYPVSINWKVLNKLQ